MYPSMLKGPGELFADFSRLQDRLDALLGEGSESSSIRAVARNGAFPVLTVGTGEEALEIYALAPGLDPTAIEVSVEKGLLSISGTRVSRPEDEAARDRVRPGALYRSFPPRHQPPRGRRHDQGRSQLSRRRAQARGAATRNRQAPSYHHQPLIDSAGRTSCKRIKSAGPPRPRVRNPP